MNAVEVRPVLDLPDKRVAGRGYGGRDPFAV